jgi:hypothetical protein
MREYLSELEVEKIEKFCEDEVMFEAVKKVLLEHIYTQGVMEKGKSHNPLKNRAFSLVQLATENPIPDEQLGAHIRGIWEGVNALEHGYEELGKIKRKGTGEVESPYNEAL